MLSSGITRTSRNASCALALALCVIVALSATDARADKYAGAFMEDGGGARALAMGGAFTAVADDPSAAFWNPAGLVDTEGYNLLLMHAERFGDLIDRFYGAFTMPLDLSLLGGEDGALALSVIRLGIDDIPITNHLFDALDSNNDGIVDDIELQGLFSIQDDIKFASDSELAVMATYAESKGDWLLGGTVKFIRQSVGDYASMGLGLDLGVLRRGLWRNLDFGAKLQDATNTFLSWSGPDGYSKNEVITPAFVPGLAYHLRLPDWGARFTLATAAETRFENRRDSDQYSTGSISTNLHLGAELALREKVFLRGGFDSGWAVDNMTLGAGFRASTRYVLLTIDYAYAGDILEIDEETHRVSITAHF
ncbi:PorV/PorQ family protein [bacterium]|nr:PorV/PorQ family protein [bacterium]